MAEDEKTSLIASVMDAGLPKLLLGPAGAAFSRLLGAKAEKTAAKLDAEMQQVVDAKEAQSKVTAAIAEKAAAMATSDPATMERALRSMVAREYQAQQNKDEVVKVATEQLTISPPPKDSLGPSAGFIHRFEGYAEDATEDDVRGIFGRLLATEIGEPGSVSASTMHFVGMLDPVAAGLIQRVLPYCTRDGVAFIDAIDPPLTFLESAELEQLGFWTTGIGLEWSYDVSATGRVSIRFQDDVLLCFCANPSSKIKTRAASLSKPGKALLAAAMMEVDLVRIGKVFAEIEGVKDISKAKAKHVDEHHYLAIDSELLEL
jgi:Protein of unknown function (DUF2806)